MNNDLISRSALFSEINSDREAAKAHPQEICERFSRFCDYAEVLVEQAPAVDAEVVRHGRWTIRIDEYDCEFMVCSECGSEFYDSENDTVDTLHNYCPNCGANMDAEVE